MENHMKKHTVFDFVLMGLWTFIAILSTISFFTKIKDYFLLTPKINGIYNFFVSIVGIVRDVLIVLMVIKKEKPAKFLMLLGISAVFSIYPLIMNLINLNNSFVEIENFLNYYPKEYVISFVLAIVGSILISVFSCLQILPIFSKKKITLILLGILGVLGESCEAFRYYSTSNPLYLFIQIFCHIILFVPNILLLIYLYRMDEIKKGTVENWETISEPLPVRRSVVEDLSSSYVLALGILILIPAAIDIFGKTPGILSVLYSLGEIKEFIEWIIPSSVENALRIIAVLESLPTIVQGCIFISTYSAARHEIISETPQQNFCGLKILRAIFAIDIAFESVKYLFLIGVMGKLSEWLDAAGIILFIGFLIYAALVVLFYAMCFSSTKAIINELEFNVDLHDNISSLPRVYSVIKVIFISISSLFALFSLNIKSFSRNVLEIAIWCLISHLLGELKKERYFPNESDTEHIMPEYPADTQTEVIQTEVCDNSSMSVKVTITDDTITCPSCGKKQNANRSVCWTCGVKFKKDEDTSDIKTEI